MIETHEGTGAVQLHKEFTKKCIQLYDTLSVRHGIMIVGESCSGKTTCFKVLNSAINDACMHKEDMVEQYDLKPTTITNIFPKSQTTTQLYGDYDPLTLEWCDGVLANSLRGVSANVDKWNWLILDGPVDTHWIENMNTVLDDNKKLCLNSGEIIEPGESVKMIFEVHDLAVASPATVSRCGMVYLEPDTVGWRNVIKSWMQSQLKETMVPFRRTLTSMFQHFMTGEDGVFDMLRGKCVTPQPVTDISLMNSFLSLYVSSLEIFKETKATDDADVVMKKHKRNITLALKRKQKPKLNSIIGVARNYIMPKVDDKDKVVQLEAYFLFALTWSFGACIDEASKPIFDTWLRDKLADYKSHIPAQKFHAPGAKVEVPLHLQIGVESSMSVVFEYYFNPKHYQWEKWVIKPISA